NLHEPLKMIFCFMHAINTIIGRIVLYPVVKKVASHNARIVSFFNGSHFWGRQLKLQAAKSGVKQSLETNTESRFYALILQFMSTRDHWYTLLSCICVQDDVQHSVNKLSPVNRDVIQIMLDSVHWAWNDQLVCVTKPLIDIIGDIEGRDATLADCMLELIWAHHKVNHQLGFHALNTNLQWFTLFFHPLCWCLAVLSAQHSHKVKVAIHIATEIAHK
ncbi:hypothetical protein PUNSTDRAFT_73413, partial [Punctularia strigosozonata HHB-11173 SS5]|uniref:uncharacterized protein n=1 Tax=Punctularia strigosozonata (strain HHB-11173) TaxID=741275 RepID=UPI000441858E